MNPFSNANLSKWYRRFVMLDKPLAIIANGKVAILLILSVLGFGYLQIPAMSQSQNNGGDEVQVNNPVYHQNRGNTSYGNGNTMNYHEDNSTKIYGGSVGDGKITAHQATAELLEACPKAFRSLESMKSFGELSYPEVENYFGRAKRMPSVGEFLADLKYMKDYLPADQYAFMEEHMDNVFDDAYALEMSRSMTRNGGFIGVNSDVVIRQIDYLKEVLPTYCQYAAIAYENGKRDYE